MKLLICYTFLCVFSLKGQAQNSIDNVFHDILNMLCQNKIRQYSVSDSLFVGFNEIILVKSKMNENDIIESHDLPLKIDISDSDRKNYDLCFFDNFISKGKKLSIQINIGKSFINVNDNTRRFEFEGWIIFIYRFNKKLKKYILNKYYIHYI